MDSVTNYWLQLYEQPNTNQAFNIKFKISQMKTKKFIQILASNLTLAMKLSLDISTLYVS